MSFVSKVPHCLQAYFFDSCGLTEGSFTFLTCWDVKCWLRCSFNAVALQARWSHRGQFKGLSKKFRNAVMKFWTNENELLRHNGQATSVAMTVQLFPTYEKKSRTWRKLKIAKRHAFFSPTFPVYLEGGGWITEDCVLVYGVCVCICMCTVETIQYSYLVVGILIKIYNS